MLDQVISSGFASRSMHYERAPRLRGWEGWGRLRSATLCRASLRYGGDERRGKISVGTKDLSPKEATAMSWRFDAEKLKTQAAWASNRTQVISQGFHASVVAKRFLRCWGKSGWCSHPHPSRLWGSLA